MSYVRGVHLPRRTLLKGIGGLAVGLPFLDAMTPAFAQAVQPKRFGLIYFPNGYINTKWTPAKDGAGYTLPYALEPLAARKDKITVLTGLANDPSKTISSLHDRAIASVYTGVEMSKTEVRVGPSVDQIAARVLGKDSPVASLELAAEKAIYFGSPNFATATNRLPAESNPRAVFERLFGGARDPAQVEKLRLQRASILDLVADETASLKPGLGAGDRIKLDEYLDSVRDIETRLDAHDDAAPQDVKQPEAMPASYADLVHLMFDLQVTALRTDKTRVWSFMLGGESSNMEFPEIDWRHSHHQTSHHGGDPVKMEGLSRINRYQVSLFDYFLEKMDAVQEANGSLLDNSLMLYLSSLGEPDHHMAVDLPVLLAGGGALGVKHGRHVRLPDHTPLTNVYLAMLDRLGVKLEQFGDSTGRGVVSI